MINSSFNIYKIIYRPRIKYSLKADQLRIKKDKNQSEKVKIIFLTKYPGPIPAIELRIPGQLSPPGNGTYRPKIYFLCQEIDS